MTVYSYAGPTSHRAKPDFVDRLQRSAKLARKRLGAVLDQAKSIPNHATTISYKAANAVLEYAKKEPATKLAVTLGSIALTYGAVRSGTGLVDLHIPQILQNVTDSVAGLPVETVDNTQALGNVYIGTSALAIGFGALWVTGIVRGHEFDSAPDVATDNPNIPISGTVLKHVENDWVPAI
jgi:hypothetical protein